MNTLGRVIFAWASLDLVLASPTFAAMTSNANSAKIEFHMAVPVRGHSCSTKREFKDFVKSLPEWQEMVAELVISVPKNTSQTCIDQIKRALKAQKIPVTLAVNSELKEIQIQGTVLAEPLKVAGESTGNEVSEKNSAMTSKSANPHAAALLNPQGSDDHAPGAKGELPEKSSGQLPEKQGSTPDGKAIVASSSDHHSPPLPPAAAETSGPDNAQAEAKVEETGPPKHPASDEIPLWRLAWLPGYYQISGTGLGNNASGFNIGAFSGSYLLSKHYEIFSDLTLPLNSSTSMPGMTILHVELGQYMIGERPSLKKNTEEPRKSVQAVAGFIFFSQSAPAGQSSTGLTQNITLLSELATPYIGIKGRRYISDEMTGFAEYRLIPVLPLSGNSFSISQEIYGGVERSFESFTGTLAVSWGSYDVKDDLVGDLNAMYIGLHAGLIFQF